MATPPLDDRDDLVVETDHEGRDDLALLAGQPDADDTLAAAALHVELVELRALAVPGRRDA